MTESEKELQSRERIKLNRNEWQPPMPPPLPPLDVHLFDTSPDKQVNHRKDQKNCQKSTEGHVKHENHGKEQEKLSVEKISRNSGAGGSYRYKNISTSSDNLGHCQNIESTESHVNHVLNHRKEQEQLSAVDINISRNSLRYIPHYQSFFPIKYDNHGKEPESLSVEEVSRNLGAGVRYNNINPAPPPPDNLD